MWTRRVLVCLLLLCARSVNAQVAFQAATAAGYGYAGSFSMSHTIGACANCVLIVGITTADTSQNVTSVLWNGTESASLLCSDHDVDSGNTIDWYARVAPTTGTHNVDVTMGSSSPATIVAASFSGVNQTSIGSAVCDHYVTNGISHAHDTTGETNGMGVDLFVIPTDAGTLVPNGGQTTRTGPTSNDSLDTILTTKAGASTINTGYSWANDFYRWSHATIGLRPVGAGGGGGPCVSLLLGVGTCG